MTSGKNIRHHILVVDDEEITRELTRTALEKEEYRVTVAASGREAMQRIEKKRFDLLIIDIQMDDMDGISLCRFIRRRISPVPPILMITTLDSEDSVEQSFAAGAADYIRKPIDWTILKNKIKYIIGDHADRQRQKRLVSKYECIFNAAANGMCAVDHQQRITFINAVLLNMLKMEAGECIGRCYREVIKLTDPEKPEEAVECFPSDHKRPSNCRKAKPLGTFKLFQAGGHHLLVECTTTPLSNNKRFSGGVLLFQDVTEKVDMLEQHRYEANHDALTKLPNRKYLSEKLPQAISLADRNNRILALLFIDLDSFKPINDTYGHKVGDKVLQKIATRLVKLLRTSDTVCRIGGDEFVIILESATSRQGVKDVAEKIIAQLNKPMLIDGHNCRLGGSIGISLFPYDSRDADSMLQHGDVAMYAAKNGGKNRCEFYEADQRSVLPRWHKKRPRMVSESIGRVFPSKLTCTARR